MDDHFVADVINKWDPMTLLAIAPEDEYEDEIFLITQAVKRTDNIDVLAREIQRVFTEAFGKELFKRDFNECITIAQELFQEKHLRYMIDRKKIEPWIRPLVEQEIDTLLKQPLRGILATSDFAEFPRLTPLYFLWEDRKFYMVSRENQPLLYDIRNHARVALSVDTRRNSLQKEQQYSQVVAKGDVQLVTEGYEEWLQKITRKYLSVPNVEQIIESSLKIPQVLLVLDPEEIGGVEVSVIV